MKKILVFTFEPSKKETTTYASITGKDDLRVEMMADNLVNEAKNVIKSMDQDLFDAITKCIRESSSPDSDSELVNLANELTLEDYKYLTKDLMVFQTEDILSEDDLSELERSCLIVKYGV